MTVFRLDQCRKDPLSIAAEIDEHPSAILANTGHPAIDDLEAAASALHGFGRPRCVGGQRPNVCLLFSSALFGLVKIRGTFIAIRRNRDPRQSLLQKRDLEPTGFV